MDEKLLRAHLLEILEGRSVHCGLEAVLAGIPFPLWGKKVRGLPYTLFGLLEHIRLAQKDILAYAASPDYESGIWPDDYWPQTKAPASQQSLAESIADLHADREQLRKLIQAEPLFKPLPTGKKGHTIAREALIAANHMDYHLGQMVVLRRLLGIWH